MSIGHVLSKPFTALAGSVNHTIQTKILMSVIRHGVTLGAGYLVARGVIDGSATSDFVGAAMALVAIVSGGKQKADEYVL